MSKDEIIQKLTEESAQLNQLYQTENQLYVRLNLQFQEVNVKLALGVEK